MHMLSLFLISLTVVHLCHWNRHVLLLFCHGLFEGENIGPSLWDLKGKWPLIKTFLVFHTAMCFLIRRILSCDLSLSTSILLMRQ